MSSADTWGFSKAIQSKTNWREKILSKEISEHYIADGVRQGLDEETARKVVKTLQSDACGDRRIVFVDGIVKSKYN